MSDINPGFESSSSFNTLNIDVTESILSHLPIPSLVRFTLVSKLWRSIITSLPPPSPSPSSSSPWLFLFGIHNTCSFHNQSFAFDPLSNSWLRLPSSSSSSDHLVGSDRFLFTTAPRFSFSPILKPNWRFTSPVRFPRINPLLSVFTARSGASKLILVGGSSRIGGLVDIEERLAVQVYDPVLDSWELCSPLPADFRSGQDHQTLTSALFRRRFYVFDNYSYFISSFCLDSYTWSDVQTLKPPGLSFAFLNSCNGMLVLGGMCGFSFNLWRIEEGSMEFSEIAVMPEDLLFGLVDNEDEEEEDSNKFRSLKCVGSGNLVYVFNDDCHKKFPACVCEIGENGKCSWRRVPRLPSPVNKFHKVASFCSTVSISDVFHPEEAQIGGLIRI
ncbi:PREDICTED: F-box/kelch-repeat protein At3g24760-like [Camelina sativa]|uniref:F-box/kelch-repeat protein At3g24760-like n=1 Tax=Camelina sativa TaxID=90675 RepID=A0ABM0W7R3_CAMSA|nr:PREDICTED: F-box/kelch-repeat protein At3g24760-like [Camelina sativa]